jgi:hypothetical protein
MSRYTYAFGYKSEEAAESALEHLFATGDVLPGEKPKIYRYACPGGYRWAIDLEGESYRSELTPEGEQLVIPGCEKDDARTGKRQLSLF